jgi:hypothetical protein
MGCLRRHGGLAHGLIRTRRERLRRWIQRSVALPEIEPLSSRLRYRTTDQRFVLTVYFMSPPTASLSSTGITATANGVPASSVS